MRALVRMASSSLATFLILAVAIVVGFFLLDRLQEQRAADAARARAELCEAVNALPAKLGDAIALRQQEQQITGPTTTVAPSSLTPDERARLADLRSQLGAAVADLGDPIDCAALGRGR